jgi:hypothetical protein
VVKPSINLQFGDGLYKPFIWFWEWVCEFFLPHDLWGQWKRLNQQKMNDIHEIYPLVN